MRCNRTINRSGYCGQVMGAFGVQRIALRGPGCISGTGRCEGVAGTGGGRGKSSTCESVLGSSRIPVIALRGPGCISGTGRCEGVAGTGDNRYC